MWHLLIPASLGFGFISTNKRTSMEESTGLSIMYIEVAERCGIDVLALPGHSVYKMKAFTISVVHLVLPGCATSTQSLSQLRLVSKTFKETIDEYAHDVWTVVLLRCLPSRNGGLHRATAERLIRNLDQFGADRKLYDALVWNAICVNLEKDRRRIQSPELLAAVIRTIPKDETCSFFAAYNLLYRVCGPYDSATMELMRPIFEDHGNDAFKRAFNRIARR